MKTIYEIQALRSDRAIYYSYEYGLPRAIEILAAEPKTGMHRVRTIGGTVKRTPGLFAKRKDADHYLTRMREVVASLRSKLTGHVVTGGSAEIVKA